MVHKFLVVNCRNVYICILGRPFAITFGIVASLVHLKLKYHNVYNEPITKNTDLFGKKRIYKALQHDQNEGEGKALEINVSSLFKKL